MNKAQLKATPAKDKLEATKDPYVNKKPERVLVSNFVLAFIFC